MGNERRTANSNAALVTPGRTHGGATRYQPSPTSMCSTPPAPRGRSGSATGATTVRKAATNEAAASSRWVTVSGPTCRAAARPWHNGHTVHSGCPSPGARYRTWSAPSPRRPTAAGRSPGQPTPAAHSRLAPQSRIRDEAHDQAPVTQPRPGRRAAPQRARQHQQAAVCRDNHHQLVGAARQVDLAQAGQRERPATNCQAPAQLGASGPAPGWDC